MSSGLIKLLKEEIRYLRKLGYYYFLGPIQYYHPTNEKVCRYSNKIIVFDQRERKEHKILSRYKKICCETCGKKLEPLLYLIFDKA